MTINSKTKLHDPCVSCRPAEVECHPKLRTTLLSKWTIIHQSPVENRVWVPGHMPDSTAKAKLSLSGHLHKPLICGLKGPPLSRLFKKKKSNINVFPFDRDWNNWMCSGVSLKCPNNNVWLECFHEFMKRQKRKLLFHGTSDKTGVYFCRGYLQPSKQFTQHSTHRIWAFKQPPRHKLQPYQTALS